MIRKSLLALAAVAALGLTASATSSDALAKGWKGGGWGKHHHHHQHHGFRRGFRIGFYAPSYQECVRVITRRGRVKVVCTY